MYITASYFGLQLFSLSHKQYALLFFILFVVLTFSAPKFVMQDADSMDVASEKKSAEKALRAKKPSETGTVEGKVKKSTS